MTNYVIEGDIDFYAELNRSDSEAEDNDKNTCLLTGDPLGYNHIILPCKHGFNYEPLFKEVVLQKGPRTQYSTDSVRLSVNQIKCPYCRRVTNKILPYVPLLGCKTRIKGVNSPVAFSMPGKACQWVYKSGKRKGKQCCSPAFEDDSGVNCILHRKLASRKTPTSSPSDGNSVKSLHELRVVDLRAMLRSRKLKVSGLKTELVNRLINHATATNEPVPV